MTTPNETAQLAVIGWPIAHSRSPEIHQLFAKQFGIDINYQKIGAPAKDDFKRQVKEFFAGGGEGMNVTLPYKHEASLACASVSKAVTKAGGANTLSPLDKQGAIFGENTDGEGLINDLKFNLQQAIRGKKVLIIGAGGAAGGILWPLLELAPASICIVNRTSVRAAKLARDLVNLKFTDAETKEHATEISHMQLADLRYEGKPYDLIIHTTSAGISGEAPDLRGKFWAEDAFAYDLSYGKAAEPFVAWARDKGIKATDGLGMLVEQAALSFNIWFGKKPDTAPVIEKLRGQE